MISYKPFFDTMKKKNVTSYQLAKKGFSRATYYSIQQGNSISTNTVNQLCKLLHCNVSDIIEFIDDEN
ncbi:MAG: helix-turn-helix transcriptional regulator [Clostridium sp.]|nr:helix-turn-helix transcriptional regulator [Clostridium sp.]MCM1173089.1 helix-turn-helix transcriptional regulator [Clostridium sp.]MCM1208088.1 helix-turn-helix transcriptional regulator [Ruminococcus sp.]